MIVGIIDDRAAETGFEPREEAAEVIAAIANHYKLNLKMIQNYLDSDDPVNPVAEGEDINENQDAIKFAQFIHAHGLKDKQIKDEEYLKDLYDNYKENK